MTTLAETCWGDLLLEHFDDEIVHSVTSSYEVKVTGYHDTGNAGDLLSVKPTTSANFSVVTQNLHPCMVQLLSHH